MNSLRTQTIAPDPRVKEILQARARDLARKPKPNEDGGTMEVIEFRLAREQYAIERGYVREVYPLKELTRIPCTPPFLLGIINVRGQIMPVMDIKKFFDLPESGITDTHMAVILHGEGIEIGILADAVGGARSIRRDSIQASLPTLSGIRAQYLKGVSDPRTVILDAARILSDPKLIVNEEVEN